MTQVKGVRLHLLSPGMVSTRTRPTPSPRASPPPLPACLTQPLAPSHLQVTTDLLLSGSDTRIAKFMINALAEKAEDVAGFLVPRIKQAVSEDAQEAYIKFLTMDKAMSQIAQRALLGRRKDLHVKE